MQFCRGEVRVCGWVEGVDVYGVCMLATFHGQILSQKIRSKGQEG